MIDKVLQQAASSSLFRLGPRAAAKSGMDSILDAVARKDPAKAQELKEKQEKADSLLNQLAATRKDVNTQRKEAARQKIEQIKAQLKALRFMAGANPKAAAQQAKQLARELSSAVKDYAASGGGMSGIDTAGAGMSAAPAGDAQAAGAASAPAEAPAAATTGEATAVPQASVQDTAGGAKDAEQPGTIATAETREEKTPAAEAQPAPGESEDDAFKREIKRIMQELKNVIEDARRKLRHDAKTEGNGRTMTAERDLNDAGKALAETEKALGQIGMDATGMPGGGIGGLFAAVDISI